MKETRKPTMTIGVPAYNEEANIKNLLQSLVEQNRDNFILDKILVVSDGSTDKTVRLAAEINDDKVKVIDRENRIGGRKIKGEIMRLTDSDILVIFDADVLPVDNNLLAEIIKPIINNEASLVGAETVPLPANDLFEKVNAHGHLFKKQVYRKINGGDNVYLCHGRGRAFSKKLYTDISEFPSDCPEDAYSYLFAKSKGFKFKYAEEAKVYFRATSDMKERETQSKRFIVGTQNLKKYFPEDFVKQQFRIPVKYLMNVVIFWGSRKSVKTFTYLMWILYLKISKNTIRDTDKWRMAKSSKKLI
jgi:glycosyltransferase involved in cell wall biosynthesis